MRIALFLPGLLLATVLSSQNTVSGTIQSGGLTREYLLYVPAVYNAATAVPLVINLHGYTSNNLAQALYGDFRAIADTANFLIVHPNGTIDGLGNRFWNTFGTSTIDDVGFISNLIDSLRAVYNIDPNRVYATGMSNGGFMSYALACDLNDRIAAIASVTGSMIAPNLAACHPERPVPVMEIHGDADNTVAYNGSAVNGFTPIPDLVAAWVGFNHCNPVPAVTQVPNTNTSDGCTATHSVYIGGDLGSTVEHYRINGGGHTWPGAVFNIGVTNQDFNASQEIWRFFRQYRLNELSATREAGTTTNGWKAFPNPVADYLILQPTATSNSIERIRVYDAQGQLIQSIRVAPDETNLRVSTTGWANGAYKLVLESSRGTETIPVVKHRP